MKSVTGQIPPDISKSIFIALPKKPGATESDLHKTINLMSHITSFKNRYDEIQKQI